MQPAVTETRPARMPLHIADTSHALAGEKNRSMSTVTVPPEAAERVVTMAIRPACRYDRHLHGSVSSARTKPWARANAPRSPPSTRTRAEAVGCGLSAVGLYLHRIRIVNGERRAHIEAVPTHPEDERAEDLQHR